VDEAAKARAERDELRSTLGTLRTDITNARREKDQADQQLAQARGALQTQTAEISRAIDKARADQRDAEARTATAQTALRTVSEQLARAQEALAKATADRQIAEAGRDAAVLAKTEAEARRKTLDDDIKTETTRLQAVRGDDANVRLSGGWRAASSS
jgi:chromosome segregation ATPase